RRRGQPGILQAPGARAAPRPCAGGRVRSRGRRLRALVLRRRRAAARRRNIAAAPLPALGDRPADADVRLGLIEHRDLARELRAFLDADLRIADLPRYLARALDHQLLAHGELALEAAMDGRIVDRDGALEHAVLG